MKTIIETELELLDNELSAEASVSLNPTFRWCKFILTDDKPNLNLMRIPKEEFSNLIRTGLYAPIKMAKDKINIGHDESIPLGTITSLKESGNTIEGLAALWTREREQDVELVKQMYDSGRPLNLSWEILYGTEEEEDGVKVLRDTVLQAATLVGLPAYGGRTPILQVASVNSEDNVTLEELQAKLDEALAEINTLKESVSTLQSEKEALESEKQELSEYKAAIEKKAEEDQKFAQIKQKFNEAGISKPETYFEENREKLLEMPEANLDFMLQELSAFASLRVENRENSSVDIPVISTDKTELDIKSLANALR